MKNSNEKWVGVFGHYGNQNYGDEAIIAAVIQNVKRYIPTAKLACFSINPENSSLTHGLESYPIRRIKKRINGAEKAAKTDRSPVPHTKKISADKSSGKGIKEKIKKIPFLLQVIHEMRKVVASFLNLPAELKFIKKSFRLLHKFDLLIVSGSNQFLDNFGGPGGFPYTLLKWTVLCKLAGVKIAYAAVGAGPLDKWRSKLYIHIALLLADYVSYRDTGSKELVEKTIFPINGTITPDLAHSLDFKSRNTNVGDKIRVGINPMPVYDSRYWFAPDEQKYMEYVEKLVDFSSWLLQQGHSLFLFNTMVKDLNVVDDILAKIVPDLREKIQVKKVDSVAELMETIDSADITVATRFHGFVLSLLAEKPLLGICYYRKSREIMEDMGQGQYAVEIDNFSSQDLKNRFQKLTQNIKIEKKRIAQKNAEYARLLDEQYVQIAKLIQ